MADTARVKSIRERSVIPKPVGSTETTRLPETMNGWLPVTVTPARVLKVRFRLRALTLTVSPAPIMLMMPMMNVPGCSVSVAGSSGLANSIATPPGALMVPESTRVLVPDADMDMPTLLGPVTLTVPELMTVTLPLSAVVAMPTLLPQPPAHTGGKPLLAVPTTLTVPVLIVVAVPVNVLVRMPVELKPVTLTLPLLTVVALPKVASVQMPVAPPAKPKETPGAGLVLTVPLTLTLPELVVMASAGKGMMMAAVAAVVNTAVVVLIPTAPMPVTFTLPELVVVAVAAGAVLALSAGRVTGCEKPAPVKMPVLKLPVTLMVPELVVVALPANVDVWMPKPPPVLMTEPVFAVVALPMSVVVRIPKT